MSHSHLSESPAQLSADHTTMLPIPRLPPRVVGYPTPWIDKEDHFQYLMPLYTRGWGVSFKRPRAKEQNGRVIDRDAQNLPQKPVQTAHLVARYKFNNYKAAVAFMDGIAEITHSENVSQQHISHSHLHPLIKSLFVAPSPYIDDRECEVSLSCIGHAN